MAYIPHLDPDVQERHERDHTDQPGTPQELSGLDYFVAYEPIWGWAWGLGRDLYGDSYATDAAAWAAALAWHREQNPEPELCERCGDQGVCPDCVGT